MGTEGEKLNKCYGRNYTILFVPLEEQLTNISFAVISLFILRENSLSEGEILDNIKIFIKLLISQSLCLQHWLGCVVMLSAFVFLGK